MTTNPHVVFAGALCLSVLSACAAQQPVRDLAERTATNAGIVSAQLNRLAQASDQLANLRAANIAQLHAANTALRANYNYDLALTKKSGAQTNLDLIPQMEAWQKEIDGIFKAADDAEEERKAAVLATQTKLETKSEALAVIAQALATLAREESVAQRAGFLAGFAKQLAQETDAQLKQSNESAAHAKTLLDALKKKF